MGEVVAGKTGKKFEGYCSSLVAELAVFDEAV
jgi:hypothetical protein